MSRNGSGIALLAFSPPARLPPWRSSHVLYKRSRSDRGRTTPSPACKGSAPESGGSKTQVLCPVRHENDDRIVIAEVEPDFLGGAPVCEGAIFALPQDRTRLAWMRRFRRRSGRGGIDTVLRALPWSVREP